MQSEKRISFTRNEMVRFRTKAIRKGVWFRALTTIERACVDLAIRVVERVRSHLLFKALSSVLKKLEDALESQVRRLMREVGGRIASKMSQIAQNWGNKSAARWAKELGFIQYLTVDYLNAQH